MLSTTTSSFGGGGDDGGDTVKKCEKNATHAHNFAGAAKSECNAV